MEIRELKQDDIRECAELLMRVYNCPPWSNEWKIDVATNYLKEFTDSSRFVGFVICDEEIIVGSLFAHARTWWTGEELYIDELYIAPEKQGCGLGKMMLKHTEKFLKDNNIDGISLLTESDKPALKFYTKNGFRVADDLVFMYK